MYGIYNASVKEFQFGICEATKEKAYKKLFKKIGHDAKKWRFEEKYIPGSPSEKDFVCSRNKKTKCHKCVKRRI